jgi:hypothetical protein
MKCFSTLLWRNLGFIIYLSTLIVDPLTRWTCVRLNECYTQSTMMYCQLVNGRRPTCHPASTACKNSPVGACRGIFSFFLHFFHLNFAKIYGPQEKFTKLYIWRRGGRR